jgi:TP901 family phage tail tape measure protein
LAYDGTLKFDTSIDSKGFQSGIDGIGSIAEKGLKATGAILAGTATAIGAIGAASVKVGSDFEASMSKVAAISGATGDDLKALTDKAKEMGATTKFSASESADALQYMAMAGWKTEDMLNGLEGIMNLAAASGEDLATTSDIVTDALTAFGLSAEDSTHFADVLAQASSNANTNVGMMGETFKYVAPVAGALGYTAEDTALAIGLMANSGIKASQAGTSLRSVMSRMAKPTKEVQGAMDKLGVSLTDSNGNMKSLNEVMGDLRNGFAGLSEAEAAEMAAALGGQEAMSGLLAIVNASDDDFDKLSDAIYSCDGAAKRMADTMNDNLQGQITILKSGLEGLGISLYENMEAPLKEVVKEAQNMVQQLQDAFDNGGLDEVVSTVGDIFAQIVEKAASAAPDLIDVASDMIQSFLTGINNNLPEIASAGVGIVTSLGSALIENTGLLWSTGVALLAEVLSGLADNMPQLVESAKDALSQFGSALVEYAPSIGESAAKIVSYLASAVIENLPQIIEVGKQIVQGFITGIEQEFPGLGAFLSGLFDGFASTLAPIAQTVVDALSNIFSALDGADPETMEALGKAIGTIAASIAALKVASEVVGGVKSLISVLGGFRKTAGSIIGIVPKVVEGFQLLSGGAGTFSEVLALEFPKLAGIVTKVTGSFGTLVSTISGIFTKIGAVVGPAISKIASLISSIGPTIAGIGAVIGGTVMAVTNFFGMLKDGFSWVKEALMVIGTVIAAVGAVILGAPALVAAVVAGIVAAVATLVVVIKDHWTQIVDFFKGIPDKIGEVVDSIVAWFQELPGRISTWLTNTITAISEWGSELYTNITTFVSEAISAVGDWFAQLPYKIGYALGTAIGTIIQWGINVKDWVTTELPKIIQSVVDWFAQLPGRIWTWLVGVVNNIIAWGQNMYTTITTAATNAVNSVINWFSQLPGRIWTWLVNTVNNVIQWGQNLYSTMTTAATNAINSVTSWFQQLPGKIWTWLVNTVTKVGQWAIDLKNKGVEAAQSLVNAVIDGVSSLPGKMKEVGVNIVNGVWSGICSAKDKFVSDVKSFFSGIVDGVKDALDINSPSRVMKKEVGRWIPPGVGEGIEEEMPELYDQTDEEMAKLAEHMQAAVDVETGKITVRSKAQAEHTADTEMPTGGDTYIDEHIEQENNYHTPVATPSEVSKAQREAARKLLGGVK